ncbi:MAG: bifunctional folylpolyglutamate synthase/dihydrofolate synthase [Oscillospiraceae bacterium]|nr:bifunctional folylpolyglutamate synthase/dihydrofolate synthase [Oscillospiraceae bacterium]
MSKASIEYINSFSWLGSRLGLDRIRELMRRLGDPQEKLSFVHLAGTNGKGSTACFLASVLQAAGYRTGLDTSPYIHTFHERMQINGVPISDEALDRIVDRVRVEADAMEDHPTTFELVTAVAFCWFLEMECDIVVLETGMGGGLDATNVISSPALTVITPIDMDHMEYLGDTIAKIASAKAGIIKPRCPVVSACQQPEAAAVLAEVAAEKESPLTVVDLSQLSPGPFSLHGQRFAFSGLSDLSIRLLGRYQMENAALVITALDVLAGRGFPVSEDAIRTGLAQALWPGRFELVATEPAVIVDGGHNAQGARALADNLVRYFPGQRLIFVMGLLADKDLEAIAVPILPLAERFFTFAPNSPRAMEAGDLAAYLAERGALAEAVDGGAAPALERAREAAGPDGVVCYFGSLYSVSEARGAFGLGHGVALGG